MKKILATLMIAAMGLGLASVSQAKNDIAPSSSTKSVYFGH